MNPSDFETKARREGYLEWLNYTGDMPVDEYKELYVVAAQWSRTETIAEILGMLAEYREAYSEEIFPPQDMSKLDPKVRTVTAGYMGRHVLDTLMRQLKEGKV